MNIAGDDVIVDRRTTGGNARRTALAIEAVDLHFAIAMRAEPVITVVDGPDVL